MTASFEEYANGILAEWKAWQAFAPQALAASQTRDALMAARLLENAMSRNLYRHNHWDIPRDILAADIDLDHWEGVVACRQAIIDEKYMLIAVVSSPTNIDSGRADFVQSNKECGEALSVKSLN
jgi:hypothetical protein